MSTIRAYNQQKRFEMENEWRVDANLRAYYPSISANRWLAVRLEFLGSVIILAAAGLAIISVASHSGLTAGTVGLAMSYALQITQSLNWIVRQTVEVETNIVSVERVLEYAALPSEAPEIISKNRPPISWPSQGAVTFDNYSTRYRPGLDLVLKNVNLSIKPKEKIGVVGRTGAGKSSLTLALFRIIEPAEGNVSIDNLNTSTIGLLDLRRRLAIIPQDAALFEGTVRDNLDPGHVHDDTELWSVLGKLSSHTIPTQHATNHSQRPRPPKRPHLLHARQTRRHHQRRRFQPLLWPTPTRLARPRPSHPLQHPRPRRSHGCRRRRNGCHVANYTPH